MAAWTACVLRAAAADVTFYSCSDVHFGADNGGKSPPMVRCEKVDLINALPGTPYPESIGGTVDRPRGVIMQGDLINDGAVAEKYPTQWADYVADFGVNGEGRCLFPVFEGIGNHDLNENLFVFNQVRERNLVRKNLGHIGRVSSNGHHYSWDWDGVHFVNVNLFPGNVWEGEADGYGRAHHPQFARDFLEEDLRRNAGDSGRPVVIVQHFRPIDENWWTYSAADKFHRAIQDYNVILILVGHQGGGVNNLWRGINWVSSNGEPIVCRVSSNRFTAIHRGASGWGQAFQKPIFRSFAGSGLPAVINNGAWASDIGATGATLSAKVVYEAASPTEVSVFWGPADGGTNAGSWRNCTNLGVRKAGAECAVAVAGLSSWTPHFYRSRAANAKGEAWARVSVLFHTAGELPDGWRTAMVGCEQRPGGGATFSDGVFTVRGSGRDIGERGERSDHFQFAWKRLAGDGEISARIATAEPRSREPKVGLMLRESPEADARHVSILLMPESGVRLVARKARAGPTSTTILADIKAAPCRVKLTRRGNTFTGFACADGGAWTQVGEPVRLDLPAELPAGLAVTAGNRDESKLHTSTFDEVDITAKPAAAP